MSSISVDVGTTTVKAVGYDSEGREQVVARHDVVVDRPHPGWAEQDMDTVWSAVCTVVREVVASLGSAPEHLAVTAQGDGAWLVDQEGHPTGPAVLWNDGRARAEMTTWERDGVLDEAFDVTGSRVTSGMPHAILAWLALHDPERLRRSASLLTCGGWVFSRLTGRLVVDESDASAPFLDIRLREWSPRLIDLYGVTDVTRLLPELIHDGDRVSGLSAAAAGALGLPAGLPVVLAPYDICATAIGAGAVTSGDAVCILGTTLSTEVVTDQIVTSTQTGITVALGAPGRWLRAFPTMAGGDVLRWSAGLLGVPDVDALFDLAVTGVPGAAGVEFLPYLSPAGERNPFYDPGARGSLTGLSFDARREDVARAVVEGLTFTIRECLEAVPTRPAWLALCGGGTASPVWTQLIADVTGLPVVVGSDREVGARGAYLTALVATGVCSDLESAVALSRVSTRAARRFTADAAQHAGLGHRYDSFLRLRAALRQARP